MVEVARSYKPPDIGCLILSCNLHLGYPPGISPLNIHLEYKYLSRISILDVNLRCRIRVGCPPGMFTWDVHGGYLLGISIWDKYKHASGMDLHPGCPSRMFICDINRRCQIWDMGCLSGLIMRMKSLWTRFSPQRTTALDIDWGDS